MHVLVYSPLNLWFSQVYHILRQCTIEDGLRGDLYLTKISELVPQTSKGYKLAWRDLPSMDAKRKESCQ